MGISLVMVELDEVLGVLAHVEGEFVILYVWELGDILCFEEGEVVL